MHNPLWMNIVREKNAADRNCRRRRQRRERVMSWRSRKSNKNVRCYNHRCRHAVRTTLSLRAVPAVTGRVNRSRDGCGRARHADLRAGYMGGGGGGFRSNARPSDERKWATPRRQWRHSRASPWLRADGMTSRLTRLPGPGPREAFIKPRPIQYYIRPQHKHLAVILSSSPASERDRKHAHTCRRPTYVRCA